MPELTSEQRLKFAEYARRFRNMRWTQDQERDVLQSKHYNENRKLCDEFEEFVKSTLPEPTEPTPQTPE